MEYTKEVDEIIGKYIDPSLIFSANRLNELGRVSLSFLKGTPRTYFIVSGIVSENNTSYECKINFKKISEIEERFSSQCTCSLWSQEKPCHHIASILMKYKKSLESQSIKDINLPLSLLSQEGVHAERYGTIIKSAPVLQGAKMNSTFSSLQYTLTSRKIVNFPGASTWKGKLGIHLVSATTLDEYKEMLYIEDKYTYKFTWIVDDSEITEISIFDVMYLFNWKTGEALDLITEYREIIAKLKLLGIVLNIQEFLRIFSPLQKKKLADIYIDEVKWEDIPVEDVRWRFSIQNSTRKSFLNLELELFSSQEQLIPILSPFLLFITEQGWGGSFRTRNDSLIFFKTLVEDFDRETQFHKKYLHSSSKKQTLTDWIQVLTTEDEISVYEPNFKKLFFLSPNIFKKVFISFLDCFTEVAFKTSFYIKDERKIIFQIPKNTLLEGISQFYHLLLPLNIPIFYDKQQIKTWKSSIRFERNNQKMDWFQLDLVISDEDLEIIKNAEISDNFLLSSKGLILLADGQKDIRRKIL